MTGDAVQEHINHRKLRPLHIVLIVGVALVLVVTAWVIGLGSSLEVTVEGPTYSPGQPLAFWVKNDGFRTIESNPCIDGRLEHKRGLSWEPVELSNKFCTLELTIYRRGVGRFGGFALPQVLEPGTYRAVQEVRVGLVTRRFTGNEFQVR